VVDANGLDIGAFTFSATIEWAVWEVGGVALLLPVSETGFEENAATVTFWHTQPNCGGTRYLAAGGGFPTFPPMLRQDAQIRGSGAAYYTGATLMLAVQSNSQYSLGSDVRTGAGVVCDNGAQPPGLLPLRAAQVLDLSGFDGPFRVQ